MNIVLLDTHVLHWLAAEPDRIPAPAREVMHGAELVVADVTWFELAWLAQRGRIGTTVPVATWLERLSGLVRSQPITPAIATRAAALPASFPRDPADRLIYATAIENGWMLITKDEQLRAYAQPAVETVW